MTVHLLTGDDESILRSTVHDLVHNLVGDGDRSLMVDEFDGTEYEVREVVDAAQTPPFLTERRVVVARGLGRFTTGEVSALVAHLEDPAPTTDLVLVGGGGQLPKAIKDAVVRAGGVVTNTSPPARPRDRQGWIAVRAEEHGIRLEPAAANLLAGWLGEDVGRLDGIIATMVSMFGTDVRIGVDQVEPFLGQAGGIPPWDFTDAIDAGNTTTALALLHRMLHGGGRHPLQIMAVLHTHVSRLARLDGIDARTDEAAAAAMGIKPGFQATKALRNYRRLGGDGVARAMELLAAADLDLRGTTELPDDLVMEVLVARLSRLGARR